MNDRDEERSGSDEAIDARAAAWLAEQDDDMSPEDARAFAEWRRADPRHEAAVVRLEQTWADLQQLRTFRPEARAHPDLDLLAPRRRRRWRAAPKFALAALALVVGLAGWRAWYVPAATYSTAAFGYQHVLLEDGTVMELRADTEVGVRLRSTERRVQLRRGEAHFTVAKDPHRPFVVSVGDISVHAVGTAFNVLKTDGRIEVLVTEGRVRIEDSGQAPSMPAAGLPDVQAGERAVLPLNLETTRTAAPAAAPVVVEKLPPEKIREVLAWQGPRLVFFETPLSEVVEEFNRHTALQLAIRDEELSRIPVVGSFRAENVEAFVRLLVNGNGIVAERSGNRIELRRAEEKTTRP